MFAAPVVHDTRCVCTCHPSGDISRPALTHARDTRTRRPSGRRSNCGSNGGTSSIVIEDPTAHAKCDSSLPIPGSGRQPLPEKAGGQPRQAVECAAAIENVAASAIISHIAEAARLSIGFGDGENPS
jgi:hypothetical protein